MVCDGYTYSQNKVLSLDDNADSTVSNALSDGQPNNNIQANVDYKISKFGVNINLNRVGEYKSIIDGTTYTFAPKYLTDLQLRYGFGDVEWIVGADNMLDVYPDQLGETDHNTRGEGKTVSYSQYSPFGYNGAYYYTRLNYSF